MACLAPKGTYFCAGRQRSRLVALVLVALIQTMLGPGFCNAARQDDQALTDEQRSAVQQLEQRRIQAIDKVIGSVIAIYDEDRQGGGSGVIIDPSGIALTNHHVIIGAGVRGWGGLADGKLYRWELIGTDPGGDVAIIQMSGRDEFPFTPLGDSDLVRAGDWALAMGNPFILTEDQKPTVTLGIVSGVKRYQPGAGLNQLVYGNCIQVDSSINPGNSGGPLFNLDGRVIGINGRGSFKERGRVNVGLGYAISSNQIKNFIPDLLATKLVEHATLDANFDDRDGKVVCSRINVDSPIAQAGLQLADELLQFEGTPIESANQFTNLICTLPEDWPVAMLVRKPDGTEISIHTRALGLPYRKPPRPNPDQDKDRSPEEEKQIQRQLEMVNLLSADPGTIRMREQNRIYTEQILGRWRHTLTHGNSVPDQLRYFQFDADVLKDGEAVGKQVLKISSDGRFEMQWQLNQQRTTYRFDGQNFWQQDAGDADPIEMTLVEAKLCLPIVQTLGVVAGLFDRPLQRWGQPHLDGSDKAATRNAYRIKWMDEDNDSFFVWFDMYGQDGLPALTMRKAAADWNAKQGGVLFEQWQPIDLDGEIRLVVARRRSWISGLAETESLSIVHRQAQTIDPPDSDFLKQTVGPKELAPTGDSESNTEQTR